MESRSRAAFLLLVLVQTMHSVEEYAFRLYDLLAPARFVSGLLGLERSAGFAIVNAALVLFGLWCWFALVRRGRPPARAVAWAWAIVETANGLGHVWLALAAGGYFPGLVTAPLLIAVGLWLAFSLARKEPA